MADLIRFLDLSVPEHERRLYLGAIDKILATGIILNGPEVDAFEREAASYCGAPHAVGVGSGTAALYIALRALHIGPGDEVILPALSFVGTANPIAATGARPVFVDIRDDLLIDPAMIEAAITPRTKAIMPVHFTGNVCDMPAILKIAERHRLPVVEDAAPAFGASLDGRKAGTFGTLGCFSMNPMKVLGSIGEAGLIMAQSDAMAQRLRDLRYHGLVNKEVCTDVSLNARLDTIQAAVLSLRLRGLGALHERRNAVAARYGERLSRIVTVPRPAPGVRSTWYCYTIQCDRRDELAAELLRQRIECKIYHGMLLPAHPAHAGDLFQFAVGQRAVQRLLCLPIHEKLTDAEVDRVTETIARFYGAKA